MSDVLGLFSSVSTDPNDWDLDDSAGKVVRECASILEARLDQNEYSFWWRPTQEEDGMIEQHDAKFESILLRSVCTPDLIMVVLSYLAQPTAVSTRENFYLPFVVAAARILNYAWGGRGDQAPYMASILFSEQGATPLRPLLGLSLPAGAHPDGQKAPKVHGPRQKEMAISIRRTYLETVGKYDLNQLPEPLPAPRNSVGNCAETWGYTMIKQNGAHREGQLGGISVRVHKVKTMQTVDDFKNTYLRAPCLNCQYIIGHFGGKSLASFI